MAVFLFVTSSDIDVYPFLCYIGPFVIEEKPRLFAENISP